jgi:antitoxin ParD1/3/4
MASRAHKPITVTLGALAERVVTRVQSGAYASASEVLRDGLRALDREDAAFEAMMRVKLAEAMADPRPTLSFDDAMAELEFRARRQRSLIDGE